MRNYFLLCGAATAGLFLLNTTGATAQTGAAPSTTSPAASAWAKNVKITAVVVPETDESALLGLSMWRFDIVAPKPEHVVELVAEVQAKGKPPRVMADLTLNPQLGWPPDGHFSLVVGQYPIYDNLGNSTKMKYQVRLSNFRLAPTGERGISSVFEVYDDPFNGLSTITPGSPERRSDGSFLLSYGAEVDHPMTKPGDAALVFRIEERSY